MTFEEMKKIVVDTLNCEEDKVTMEASLTEDAWERYLKLVRRAGLASYTELMQTAGLKVPFEDGSIKAIAQQMGQWIAEHQV